MSASDDIAELCNGIVPWNRGEWHGDYVSLDGTRASDFSAADVAEWWRADASSHDDWDGEVAAIFRLNDGRWVAFETNWGPTGNGFSEDAYGGDASIFFARSKENAARLGLTTDGRRLLGITDEMMVEPEIQDVDFWDVI